MQVHRPLQKRAVIGKSCVFYTIFVSIRGQAAFYLGLVFPCSWVCMKRCTDRKKANFVQLNYSTFLHWIRNRINRSSFVLALWLWIAPLFKMMSIINFFIFSSLLWAWHPDLAIQGWGELKMHTIFVSVRGWAYFFWGRYFCACVWICTLMKICTNRK